MNMGAIIAVAGLSSRMQGGFKPLLPLGNKSIIEHVIDHAFEAGLSQVVVVVGKHSNLLRETLANRAVTIIENPFFETTDMMTSIKYGLAHLSDELDAFFVMPGDMPLVTAHCYQELMCNYLDKPRKTMVKSIYGSKGGHPILIGMDLRSDILAYKGENGLKGALANSGCKIRKVQWNDRSIIMDVDTPEDYDSMIKVYETGAKVHKINVFAILQQNKTPEAVIRHSMAVEQKALALSQKAAEKGYRLNTELIHTASLLHDVERVKPKHAAAGAQLLEQYGMQDEANVVREHMFISEDAVQKMDERAIVFLADKLIQGTETVTVEKRFERKLNLYRKQTEVYNCIYHNMENAKRIEWNIMEG